MNNKLAIASLLFVFSLVSTGRIFGACHDTANPRLPYEYDTKNCSSTETTITKRVYWTIYWLDSNLGRPVDVIDTGITSPNSAGCFECWPQFDSPYWVDDGTTATWYQKTYTSYWVGGGLCTMDFYPTDDHHQGHTCRTPGTCLADADWVSYPSTGCITGLLFGGPCTRSTEFQSRCMDPTGYDEESCSCPDGINTSPIVIDVDNSGFSMTDADDGVVFNILNDVVPLQVSWIAVGATNAFLVLDRNGNGTIDNGEELFGNLTPQPFAAEPNGFLALAEYDKPSNGGNASATIDSGDSIFGSLRLWQDSNHNGISEASELHTLPSLGVDSISLDFKEAKKTDEFGNKFRYRSKVDDAGHVRASRWAWDVFLTVK